MSATEDLVARVIAEARERAQDDPGTKTKADFEHHVAVEGMNAAYFRDCAYTVANEGYEVYVGMGQEKLNERRERGDRLWEQVEPGIEAFVQECRSFRYTRYTDSGERLRSYRKVAR